MSKNYLLIASSISFLCLTALATPTLAQTSLPGAAPEISVSQLADVQPTDWEFQSLQSLIERYGIIASSPQENFQGNRVMTRNEFAVHLNAVLGRVNKLIASGLIEQVSREDWATLQRLQQEYAAELTTLQVRLDSLEVRVAELAANQFSPTTTLTGQTIFAISGGGFGNESLRDSSASRIIDPTGREIADENPKTTLLYRTALDFNTSFFGTDLLKVRLDTGSNGSLDHTAGVLEPNFGSVLDFSVRPSRDRELGIERLYYTFTPSADFRVSLGPAIAPPDFVDQNRYANRNFLDFSTQALLNNYILFPINDRSSGAAIDWKLKNGLLTVRAVYVAADAANPSDRGTVAGLSPLTKFLYPREGGNRGLFGDPYQGIVELEYAPSKIFTLRLHYSGGSVFDRHFDVFGANFELAVSRRLGIFGRYGYGSYDGTAFGDLEPNYWMAGMSFRNLLVPGAVAGIAAGQPFIESAMGNATQTNFEAYYNFPLSDNFGITPLVQVITNPANQDNNGTIVTGTLRTVFSF